jgi:tripartite-type tricarboxylate transporter receptor subunit TctC
MTPSKRHVASGVDPRRRRLTLGLAGCILPVIMTAQPGAAKAVRLIVGFTPGGSADFIARLIAPALSEALGASVIVGNRPGASGTIAGAFVARSTPDGTILLVGSASPVLISPQVLQKSPFHPLTDLAGVGTIGLTPQVIAVSPGTGIRTLKDLLAAARTRQVSLASSGTGGMTHLTIELLARASGGRIVHVPYKGAGPSITDALAGHVQGVVSDLTPLVPMLQDGRLRALAVTSESRVDLLPDVPAVSEALPGFNATNWAGMLAPAGTPRQVLERLHTALATAIRREDVKAQLRKAGFVPSGTESPEAFQKFIADDFARWGRLIKELDIVLTD